MRRYCSINNVIYNVNSLLDAIQVTPAPFIVCIYLNHVLGLNLLSLSQNGGKCSCDKICISYIFRLAYTSIKIFLTYNILGSISPWFYYSESSSALLYILAESSNPSCVHPLLSHDVAHPSISFTLFLFCHLMIFQTMQHLSCFPT